MHTDEKFNGKHKLTYITPGEAPGSLATPTLNLHHLLLLVCHRVHQDRAAHPLLYAGKLVQNIESYDKVFS